MRLLYPAAHTIDDLAETPPTRYAVWTCRACGREQIVPHPHTAGPRATRTAITLHTVTCRDWQLGSTSLGRVLYDARGLITTLRSHGASIEDTATAAVVLLETALQADHRLRAYVTTGGLA